MRGKAYQYTITPPLYRITPAYAGKSSRRSASSFSLMDHPRLCGEKMVVKASKQLKPGSPPPMRGKGNELDLK